MTGSAPAISAVRLWVRFILRHFFNERGLGDQVNVESSGVSDEEGATRSTRGAVSACYANVAMVMIPRDHFRTPHPRARKSTVTDLLFLPLTASHMRAPAAHAAGRQARRKCTCTAASTRICPCPKPGREDQIDLWTPW